MIRESLAPFRTTYRFLKNDLLFGTLLYRYGVRRHEALLQTATRSQAHTYTQFYRSPGQLEAMAGPVLDKLLVGRCPEPLSLLVFASSNGAEPYTIASVLRQRRPDLEFGIVASDLHPEMVSRARVGIYRPDEVHYWGITDEFIAHTFDSLAGIYIVKPELKDLVRFEQANLLDADIGSKFERADLVFMQNILCHLNAQDATTAFEHVLQFLKPRAGLFIDGMNLDLRERLTARAGLEPLDYKCREIHEFSRTHIGNRWWNYYYGIEPYVTWHDRRLRRYSTIFFRENAGRLLRGRRPQPGGREMVADLLTDYLAGATGIQVDASDDLLERVLQDTEDIVNLLSFVENTFDVQIEEAELRACNFESLHDLAELILNGRGGAH